MLALTKFFYIKIIRYNIFGETTNNTQIECQIVPILTRTSSFVKTLYVQDFDSISQSQFFIRIGFIRFLKQQIFNSP